MATTTTERRPTAATASSNQLLLRLYLSSLSTASKVIVKHGATQHHQQAAGCGGCAFQCKTCGRTFQTFQALGGHRTSHKRPLVRPHGLDLLLSVRPGKGPAAAASDVHRCGNCGAVFPTGQALGGHMRRHRAVAAVFDDVAIEGEMAMRALALSSGEQGESEEDDVEPVRLFKFI